MRIRLLNLPDDRLIVCWNTGVKLGMQTCCFCCPLKFQQAIVIKLEIRPSDHFPVVSVQILQISMVTAPKGVLRFFYDFVARFPGQLNHGIHIFFVLYIIGRRNA